MASETESLSLVVNLTDNASAGLAKLRGELTNIGGGQQTQNLRRFKEELGSVHKIAHELAGEFIGLSRAVPVVGRQLSTGLSGLVGMVGPVGLGIAAIGGAVAAVILEVSKLATELRGIRNISNLIGIEPATLKTFQDRAREVGVSAEVVTSTLHGMRNALAELYKPGGGTLRATVLAHTKAGQVAETEQFLEDLKGMTDETRFKAIIHRGENVFRHELERTRSAGRPGGDTGAAARKRSEYLAQFGVDEQARLLGDKFKEMTAEERKAYNERNAAGARAADAESRLGTEIHRVGEELFAGTNLMNSLTAAARVLTNLLKGLHPGSLPGSVKGAATGAKYGSWLGPVGTAAGAATGGVLGSVLGGSEEEKGGLADQMGISGIPKGTGPAGNVEPQYFGGPLSTNIEDRRGEHDDSNKLLAENTAQLKRIADMMELNKADESQLNFGPANVVRPGAPGTQGGGFGGDGGGGFGGGSGAGAPYGSSVGPGTGTGAGRAGPGAGPGSEAAGAPPSGPGGGNVGWWTPERANHAVQKLVAAGFPEVAAKGMVARWAFEAPKGPGDINRRSGAYGIAQWLGSRRPGALRSGGDFDKQIDYAIQELKGPEARAARLMRAARTPEEAAAAASAYERAERPFIGATLKNYSTLFGGGRTAPPSAPASKPTPNVPISTAPLTATPPDASTPIRVPPSLGMKSPMAPGSLVVKEGNLTTGAVTPPAISAADRAANSGLVVRQGDLTTGELAGDRAAIDRRSGRQSVKIDATGKVNADIRAPGNAENTPMEGLFRNIQPDRQTQMGEAQRGPVDVQPAAPSGI